MSTSQQSHVHTPRPHSILTRILVIVFIAEAIVMSVLPKLVPPDASEPFVAAVDSSLLTLICAPILWWTIIGPLRGTAIAESSRAASIIAAAADGIITTDDHGIIDSFNAAAERIFGHTAHQAIGQPFKMLLAPGDTAGDQDENNTPSSAQETQGLRLNGGTFPMSITASTTRLAGRDVSTAIVRDITQQKRAQQLERQQHIAQAQQMAIVARLATGVAHELRNPLTSVKLLVQNNREEFHSRGVPEDDLVIIEREIHRMERSLNSFLEYARPSPPKRSTIDVAPLIDQVLSLVDGRAFRQKVACLTSNQTNTNLRIDADPDKIQQLLLNLALNALDAMPRNGTLHVRLDEAPNRDVLIQFIDSGPGISPEVLETMFDPFFTTKETGVGLGLLISTQIAEQHGGTLVARNNKDGGATLELRLPAALRDGRHNDTN